jgi:uncharacterized protein (TIGR02271 family)
MMGTGELREGMKVRSADGRDLGKIVRFDVQMLLIEKGFFFPKDYEIPVSLVSDVRDGDAWLSITEDELKRDQSRWSETDTSYRATGDWAGAGGTRAATERYGTRERETERLTLSEEELEAQKTMREAGEVRVHKEVHTEHRQMDVPVTREEVHVERVPASASTTPDAGADFREKTISVPVREEEVEIRKRPKVREEVRVSKTPHVEERRVEGEVRREDAKIDRTDDDRDRLTTSEDDRDERGGGILGLGRDDER